MYTPAGLHLVQLSPCSGASQSVELIWGKKLVYEPRNLAPGSKPHLAVELEPVYGL